MTQSWSVPRVHMWRHGLHCVRSWARHEQGHEVPQAELGVPLEVASPRRTSLTWLYHLQSATAPLTCSGTLGPNSLTHSLTTNLLSSREALIHAALPGVLASSGEPRPPGVADCTQQPFPSSSPKVGQGQARGSSPEDRDPQVHTVPTGKGIYHSPRAGAQVCRCVCAHRARGNTAWLTHTWRRQAKKTSKSMCGHMPQGHVDTWVGVPRRAEACSHVDPWVTHECAPTGQHTWLGVHLQARLCI